MGIYIIIILFLFLSLCLDVNKNNRTKKVWLGVVFSVLTVLSATRAYQVGTDTLQYYNAFKTISYLNWNQGNLVRYERGFFYLNKFISLISKNPQFFLMVTSIIIIPSVGVFIFRYSKNVTFSTLLYVLLNIYFFHMTGMRQSIAVSLLLLSLPFLESKQFVKFSLVVFVASWFHLSAILFLLAIFLKKTKYQNVNYLYTLIIMAGCFALLKPLFLFVSSAIGKYGGYIFNEKHGGSNYLGAFFQFMLTFTVYTFCNYLFLHHRKHQSDNESSDTNELFLKLLSIDTICQCMSMGMTIVGRMHQFFWIYSIVLVPNLIEQIKKNKDKLALYITFTCLAFVYWFIIGIYRPEWNGAIPYSFFWE